MLSEAEQRSWDEIEQRWAEDTRAGAGVVLIAIGAAGTAFLLAAIGAAWAALVLLAVPVLAWCLSGRWQEISAAWAASVVPMDGSVDRPQPPRRTPEAS